MISEYKKNTKEFWQEEPFDFFFYRMAAFLMVKLTYKLPLRQTTFLLLGLITAIFSGFTLSKGTHDSFALGGIGIIVFGIFDCCDGMLARMKKNGTKYGPLIDMVVDVLSSISFFTGLTIGLSKTIDDFYLDDGFSNAISSCIGRPCGYLSFL